MFFFYPQCFAVLGLDLGPVGREGEPWVPFRAVGRVVACVEAAGRSEEDSHVPVNGTGSRSEDQGPPRSQSCLSKTCCGTQMGGVVEGVGGAGSERVRRGPGVRRSVTFKKHAGHGGRMISAPPIYSHKVNLGLLRVRVFARQCARSRYSSDPRTSRLQ